MEGAFHSSENLFWPVLGPVHYEVFFEDQQIHFLLVYRQYYVLLLFYFFDMSGLLDFLFYVPVEELGWPELLLCSVDQHFHPSK